MKIAVTGANGLLGSHLCRHLEGRDDDVVRLRRGASGRGEAEFDLGRAVQPESLAGLDALVHCAYDFKAVGWNAITKTNVDGSLRLITAASQAAVSRIVFISSISAFAGCKSDYGRGKLLVEKAVCDAGGVAIRPGLIYGDPQGRGMFGALARLTRLPLLPVFSGGGQPLYPVHIDDLVAFIGLVLGRIDEVRGRVLYAASAEPLSMRRLLMAIGNARGRKVRTISVPASIALAGLRVADRAGISIGFKSDNLVSLLNYDPAPAVARNHLGFQFRQFDAGSASRSSVRTRDNTKAWSGMTNQG